MAGAVSERGLIVDIGQVAKELAVAHADLLTAGIPVTVSSLLVESGRCPSCTRPLLRGDSVALCPHCGSQVDQC